MEPFTVAGDVLPLQYTPNDKFIAERVEKPYDWRLRAALCRRTIPISDTVLLYSFEGGPRLRCCKECQKLHQRSFFSKKRTAAVTELEEGPEIIIQKLVEGDRDPSKRHQTSGRLQRGAFRGIAQFQLGVPSPHQNFSS